MIVSAGEALVDLVPDPVPGGGPMNAAIAAARLDVPTAFLGRVSTDDFGEMIWNHLQESGVDLSVAERGPEPSCRAVVEGDPPVFHFYGEGTADLMLTSTDLSPLGPGPHILHGGTLSMFRLPAADAYAQLVASHDGLVSLDPNTRPQIVGPDRRDDWMGWFHRWLPHVDLLRVSDADLAWIWPGRSPEDVAAMLLARGIVALVVTTARNALVFTQEGSATVSARKVAVVDTVGAGDSFCGGMLVKLHEAGVRTGEQLGDVTLEQWREVLDFAALVASICVSRAGADPPWRSEMTGRQ